MSIEKQLEKKIDIDKIQARDIMFPRGALDYINVTSISKNQLQTIIDKFKECETQFLLCCNKSLNTESSTIGVCSLVNICEQLLLNKDTIDLIDNNIQLSFFVENQHFTEVIAKINQANRPLGVVVDKMGDICGCISKESILDFFTDFNVSGSESIHRFSSIIPKDIFKNIKSETIGGFIMEYLDKIPNEGENFILNNYQFTIIEMNKNTITSVAVTAIDRKR